MIDGKSGVNGKHEIAFVKTQCRIKIGRIRATIFKLWASGPLGGHVIKQIDISFYGKGPPII